MFDKVYGCYYRAVKQILREAVQKPLSAARMEEIVRACGFQESALTILPKIKEGTWSFGEMDEQGNFCPAVSHVPLLPLTYLQKSWLKALLSDPRIGLFVEDEERKYLEKNLDGVEALYSEDDFYYFDRYLDGDDYASPEYQKNFRTALLALRVGKPLFVAYAGKRKGREMVLDGDEGTGQHDCRYKERPAGRCEERHPGNQRNGSGDCVTHEALPIQMQYSSKDDKFRLCCLERFRGDFSREVVFNMARIRACHISRQEIRTVPKGPRFPDGLRCEEPVTIAISGERNSLERCMLHFANYEKHTEFDRKRGEYICSIHYDRADETELLVELLSFGPVIRILGPEPFLCQVRERARRQHELLYGKA